MMFDWQRSTVERIHGGYSTRMYSSIVIYKVILDGCHLSVWRWYLRGFNILPPFVKLWKSFQVWLYRPQNGEIFQDHIWCLNTLESHTWWLNCQNAYNFKKFNDIFPQIDETLLLNSFIASKTISTGFLGYHPSLTIMHWHIHHFLDYWWSGRISPIQLSRQRWPIPVNWHRLRWWSRELTPGNKRGDKVLLELTRLVVYT